MKLLLLFIVGVFSFDIDNYMLEASACRNKELSMRAYTEPRPGNVSIYREGKLLLEILGRNVYIGYGIIWCSNEKTRIRIPYFNESYLGHYRMEITYCGGRAKTYHDLNVTEIYDDCYDKSYIGIPANFDSTFC